MLKQEVKSVTAPFYKLIIHYRNDGLADVRAKAGHDSKISRACVVVFTRKILQNTCKIHYVNYELCLVISQSFPIAAFLAYLYKHHRYCPSRIRGHTGRYRNLECFHIGCCHHRWLELLYIRPGLQKECFIYYISFFI